MPALAGFVNFTPDKDVPSLKDKVIFVTGGTNGLGRESILALAKRGPAHVYFTGRNVAAAESLIAELARACPSTPLTFLELDMLSLASVKAAVSKFAHARLDILMCNAGIMAAPPKLSKDGFEMQFATNHLAHAMIIQHLLPILQQTAEAPGSDVRVVCLTSEGWGGHPRKGILFSQLRTPMDMVLGPWIRYGQSKLANIVYARELARQYPGIMAVSIHPGVAHTGLVNNLPAGHKATVHIGNFLIGRPLIEPWQGCLNQVWAAAGAKRNELVSGAFYYPIGVMSNDKLDKTATSQKLADELWKWTNEVLVQY